MKNAIRYVRISTKDQSNFSVDGQLSHIEDFCKRREINVVATFTDEGKSAKSFDRPDWNKLEDFVKKHHKTIDYVVVCKYDRFSRNAAEGLRMIELLEKKYGIVVLSVFEQMFIDYDSPYFFKQRADMLVTAEFELHVIKERIRFGQHQAIKSGRFIAGAPYGYENIKDVDGKPNISIVPEEADRIRKLYSACYMGAIISELNSLAKALGIPRQGNSAIKRILTNPLYAGYLTLPSYKSEPGKVIKGRFEPIIEDYIWHRVQELMSGERERVIEDENFPFRGILKCECGKCYSGAFSKGKNKYYPYYKCAGHPGGNYSATKLHGKFDEILLHFNLPATHVDYLIKSSREQLKIGLESQAAELLQKQRELKKVMETLESLEEKFLKNQVNHDTYSRWAMKYNTDRLSLSSRIEMLQGDNQKKYDDFERLAPSLANVSDLYHDCTLADKKAFLRLVFDNQLAYYKDAYRTPFLLPVFESKGLILNEKGLLYLQGKTATLPQVEGMGTQSNTSERMDMLISWISKVS